MLTEFMPFTVVEIGLYFLSIVLVPFLSKTPPTSMNGYMTYWLRLNTLHYNILNKCDDIIKLDIISGK